VFNLVGLVLDLEDSGQCWRGSGPGARSPSSGRSKVRGVSMDDSQLRAGDSRHSHTGL